jgi:transposase
VQAKVVRQGVAREKQNRCSMLSNANYSGLDGLSDSLVPGKVVVAAVMRKLLHLAFGVVKSGQPFDPNWLIAF